MPTSTQRHYSTKCMLNLHIYHVFDGILASGRREIRTHAWVCFSIRERNFTRSKVNTVPLAGRKTHHAWVLISDLLTSKVATIVRCSVPLYYFIYLLLFFE